MVEAGTAVPEHLAVQLPPAAQAAAAAPDSSVALATVLERSRQLCLLQYEREQYNPHSFMDLFTKLNAILTDEQLSVFAGGLLGWLWLWQIHANRKSGWLYTQLRAGLTCGAPADVQAYIIPNHFSII